MTTLLKWSKQHFIPSFTFVNCRFHKHILNFPDINLISPSEVYAQTESWNYSLGEGIRRILGFSNHRRLLAALGFLDW